MATRIETVTETREVRIRSCDLCGKTPHPVAYDVRACCGCGRDMCFDCRNGFGFDEDPFTGQDEPTRCCPVCHPLALTYAPIAAAIRDKYQAEIDALRERWKAECAAAVKGGASV